MPWSKNTLFQNNTKHYNQTQHSTFLFCFLFLWGWWLYVFQCLKAFQNLANLGGLRARLSLKQATSDLSDEDEDCRPWRRRLSMAFTWGSALRITLFILLVAAVVFAFFTLPVEKVSFSSLFLVILFVFLRWGFCLSI